MPAPDGTFYGEADTRAKLIDPAIFACGWTEDHIRREETEGGIEIADGKPSRGARGKMDYVLRLRVSMTAQPVAVAYIEAKRENSVPTKGLQQVKRYQASAKRLNVPFVYSSNGKLFVEFDAITGQTSPPRPISAFPTPEELRARYEAGKGFALDSDAARPLLVPYAGGEGTRRYYQDAAIRAVFEKIATGKPDSSRALLSLATGAGKTFIAVNLLKRVADAGQLRKALFLCDRDELPRRLSLRLAMYLARTLPRSSRRPTVRITHGTPASTLPRTRRSTSLLPRTPPVFSSATTRRTISLMSSLTSATAQPGANGSWSWSATPRRFKSVSPPHPGRSNSTGGNRPSLPPSTRPGRWWTT